MIYVGLAYYPSLKPKQFSIFIIDLYSFIIKYFHDPTSYIFSRIPGTDLLNVRVLAKLDVW